MDTTLEQFLEASRAAGLRADLVYNQRPGDPQGVNVWADPDDRYPTTTVWWPRPGNPGDLIVWGHAFQHSAHRGIPAETLVERVKETLS